ncbi:MAG: enoyl-CoA hydratase [Rhodomicrobium sp.]|nr:MAG: enoyl-CoA hydratase [Rhodomicrobium sp.]
MQTIDLEITSNIGRITLNAPDKLNALSEAMWGEVPKLVAAAEADERVRVIVLSGAGNRAFSAGADISEFAEARSGTRAAHYNKLNNEAFEALQNCRKPTISEIRGFCLGGGFLLALSTDLRLAAHGASFSLPPARLGLGFDVRWISPIVKGAAPHFVKEMLFTGARYSASEVERFGLLNHVVDEAKLSDKVLELATTIAANAPLTLENVKSAIDGLAMNDQSIDFKAQDELTRRCFDSEDYREGQAAFAEKRKPKFSGK